ncbi:MAG: TaqI-like C-terminal specificity domain-containing protein, partial [FCB group bacterium]
KKKILLNNIYGVDIDSQAVEVTKLSLLLTLMEGEIVESRGQLFLKSISEALLPNLDNNIKCGNSLIGTDFYNDKDLQLFGKEEQRKINCFDWEVEFPEIFKTSKVNIQDSISKKLQKHSKAAIDNLDSANYHIEKFVEYTQELTDTFVSDTKAEYKIETKEKGGFDCVIGNPPWGADFLVDKNYFIKNYKNLSPDSAAFFLEKAIRLSKELTAFIVPKTISFYSAWESIRKFIIDNTNINNILDAGIAFPEVNLESIILILNKTKFGESPNIFRANPLKRPFIPKEIEFLGKYDKEILKICNIIPHISLTKEESRIIDKLYKNCIKVEDISLKIFRSLYISDADKENLKVGKFKFINKVPDVKRYYIEKVQNINISTNKKWLEKAKRIMVPRVFFKVLRGNRIISYPDVNGEFLTTEKLVNLIIYKEKYPVSELFLSGIMNSKVPSFYLEKVLFSDTTETSRVMDSIYLNHIPVPKIDFSNKTEKAQHDRMVSLVEQMLDAQKEAHSEKNISEKDKQLAQQRIKILDKQIDYLVYELYGLTEEEVKIVEGEGN